jgi:hypothetical protein
MIWLVSASLSILIVSHRADADQLVALPQEVCLRVMR